MRNCSYPLSPSVVHLDSGFHSSTTERQRLLGRNYVLDDHSQLRPINNQIKETSNYPLGTAIFRGHFQCIKQPRNEKGSPVYNLGSCLQYLAVLFLQRKRSLDLRLIPRADWLTGRLRNVLRLLRTRSWRRLWFVSDVELSLTYSQASFTRSWLLYQMDRLLFFPFSYRWAYYSLYLKNEH